MGYNLTGMLVLYLTKFKKKKSKLSFKITVKTTFHSKNSVNHSVSDISQTRSLLCSHPASQGLRHQLVSSCHTSRLPSSGSSIFLSTSMGAEAPAHRCTAPAAAAVNETLAPFPPLHSHIQLFIFRGFINAASPVTPSTHRSPKSSKKQLH